MRFGEVALEEATGGVLAHAIGVGTERLKKGTLLGPLEIEQLQIAGVISVIIARLETGDVDEDAAAARLASLCDHHSLKLGDASTGRVNTLAHHDGLFVVKKVSIDAVNEVDPAITIATLKNHAPVTRGQMVATVKIIPFAVESSKLAQIAGLFEAQSAPIFQVLPWRKLRVGLVTTVLPSLKTEVIEKTNRVLQARLALSGSTILAEKRVAHTDVAVAAAIADFSSDALDMIIVFGASAVVDAYDVIPNGIRLSGGRVIQVGMPVDPGNLLVLGEIGQTPIVGAPSCARSPKENGFDWILDRLIAGVVIAPQDMSSMGVGGLLMEIETRPRPREFKQAKRDLRLAGLVLAAGRSSRMGGSHKLRALFDGVPLIARSVKALEIALAKAPLVVLGHDAVIMSGLMPDGTQTVFNPDFGEGLSTSLRVGIANLPRDVDGVLIHLADMPAVTSEHLVLMAEAFTKSGGNAVVRATNGGKRGNPVILPRPLFGQVARLTGDMGARPIIESFAGSVIDVELGEAASLDVDTPEALRHAGGVVADF